MPTTPLRLQNTCTNLQNTCIIFTMRSKKLTLALLLILSFTLTGCTLQELPVVGKFFGGGFGANQKASLTMWGLWESPTVMSTLIKKYQEKFPNVTIAYDDRSVLKPVDYRERIFTQAEQGVTADIVLVHNTWVPKLKSGLSPMPSSLMTVADYQKVFYPVAAQSAVVDGKIYAMPLYYDGLVLLYNKDHFAEIDQQTPPTSWQEFISLAKKLTIYSEGGGSSQVIIRSGAAIGTADNIEHFSDVLGLMFAQTSVSLPKDIATTAAADALDFYTAFVKQYRVWGNSFPEANIAFAQGKTSMIFVPSWRILDILAANPTLNFGVAPVPQALPDKPASWGSFWMLAVPAGSKNSAAAWNFINFVGSEEAELLMFSEASKLRPFGVPFARVSVAPQIAGNQYLKPLIDTAPFAQTAEIAARAGNNKSADLFKEAINAVLRGSIDSAGALKNVAEGKTQP